MHPLGSIFSFWLAIVRATGVQSEFSLRQVVFRWATSTIKGNSQILQTTKLSVRIKIVANCYREIMKSYRSLNFKILSFDSICIKLNKKGTENEILRFRGISKFYGNAITWQNHLPHAFWGISCFLPYIKTFQALITNDTFSV